MLLPRAVRAPLVSLERRVGGPHTTSAQPGHLGPDTVPGVLEWRAAGFEPLEEHTGALWVAEVWPDPHRAFVAETRPMWLDGSDTDGRLWLVRSPWPALDVPTSLNVLWTWVERDHADLDRDRYRQRVEEALAWGDDAALQWCRQVGL